MLMRSILLQSSRNQHYFSTINAQYLKNRLLNAVRFESQNINWDFDQLNYQVTALSKGLSSLKFKANDNFLIRIPSNQQAEGYIARLGTAAINANLIISKGQTAEQIAQQIQQNNASCFIFQPSISIGQNSLIDALNTIAPELRDHVHGSTLSLKRFPHLRAFVQTNFYSYPGVYKFRAIMNYASNKYCSNSVEPIVEPIKIPQSQNPLIITEPTDLFAYRAGILNSVANGRFVVCVEPKDLSRICEQVYHNNVDVITTSQQKLDARIRVLVQKGSALLREHANRVQV